MLRESCDASAAGQAVKRRTSDHLIPLVFISFFLSGTAGLIYEIAWLRLLTLSFGSMVFAVGAVLSSFMAGLALGNFLIGRFVDRWRKPLIAYAALEAAIGVSALLTPYLLRLTASTGPQYETGVSAFLAQAVFTFLLSFAVLIVPTALMGGTLPVLSRALVARKRETAGKVGALYSLNTFGGAAGVAIGGMILLPVVGIRNAMLLAAGLNFSIAVVVLAFSLRRTVPVRLVGETGESAAGYRPRSIGFILLLAAALSGLTSMIYEVSWTRSLALIIGSSIYAFSTMLLSFIFGIAAGSLLFARFFRTRSPTLRLLSYTQAGIALTSIAIFATFDRLPALFLKMYGALGPGIGFLFIGELLICFLVMLAPALLFGASLPLVAHIFAERASGIGRSVGTVYGSNTLGCIVGSAGASFLLVPIAGLETTLKVAAGVNLLVSALVFISSRGRALARLGFSIACLVCVAVIFAAPREWNKQVMSVGVAPNAVWLDKLVSIGDLEMIASVPELLYYKDGLSATVAVKKDRTDISMSIDGKTDASAVGDLPTQMLVGYLPLFIHPDPETVMVLGLGSGISLAATVSFGVEYSECLEIEPAVVEASRFFSHVNKNILEHPGARVIIADGRHHLLSTGLRYDVITSEPSNPWMAGISSLFTREFYEICASRLKERGVMCQFIHGYSLSPEDFKMVMRTFSSVFPHKQLWSSAFGLDYLMIGSLDSLSLDIDRIGRRMETAEIRKDLLRIDISTPRDLLAHYIMQDSVWDGLAEGSPMNTDNLPLLEFSAPKSLYMPTDMIQNYLRETVHTGAPPAFGAGTWTTMEKAALHVKRGDLFFLHEFFGDAVREYTRAESYSPDWAVPYLRRAGVHLTTARRGSSISLSSAAQDLERAFELGPGDPSVYGEKAKLAQMEGMPEDAAIELKKAIEIEPRGEFYEELVDILVDDLKDYSQAERYTEEALGILGNRACILERKGYIAEITGRPILAVQSYQQAIAADPYSRANYRLGRLLLGLGEPARALESLEHAVRLGPTFAETHIALAKAYARTGKRRKAIRAYRTALKIAPDNIEAQDGLNSLR